MTNNIKKVCVFASSSNNLEEVFYKEARNLGLLLGKKGFDLVYGGSRRGLMFACAEAVKNGGGKVYGVMPEIFANMGLANHEDCNDFHITSGMRERKAKMDELSDAVVAIAGGFGTLEELSEMIVQKQLGYNNKPIVILNTDNFYNDLLKFFENTIQRNFANRDSEKLFYVASTVEDAVKYIEEYEPEKILSKFSL